MLKAPGLQIPNMALLGNAHAGRISDFTNLSNRDSVYALGQAPHVLWPNGEQQFEIFATVQGQRQWIQCAPAAESLHIFVQRNRGSCNRGSGATLFAQVIQVGRQAVAQVDHGRSELLLPENDAPADAWLGTELAEQERLDGFLVGMRIGVIG